RGERRRALRRTSLDLGITRRAGRARRRPWRSHPRRGQAVISLVLGGARSGKSAIAERMAATAAGDGAVTYVATIGPTAGTDADLAARVARHRERRPDSWTTVEPPYDLATVIGSAT